MHHTASSRQIRALLCLSAWMSGTLMFQSVPYLPGIQYLLLLLPAAVMLLKRQQPVAAWFLIGLAWALFRAYLATPTRLPEPFFTGNIEVHGQVASLPQRGEGHTRFQFKVTAISGPQHIKPEYLPLQLQLNWFKDAPNIKAGERWTLTIHLKPVHGLLNPGGPDTELRLFSAGIAATGTVKAGHLTELQGRNNTTWQGFRQQLNDRIADALGNTAMRGLIQALVLGATQDISQEQWRTLRITGTTHLIAISGSHIGMIALMVFYLCEKLLAGLGVTHQPPYRYACMAALIAAVLYTALADFVIPAQRALVMTCSMMIAMYCRRAAQSLWCLLLALAALCLIDPLSLLNPGCWLSFAAVICIVFTAPTRVKSSAVYAFLHSNWVCSIGLAPLLLYFFGQVSVIGPAANLMAVPLLGMILTPMALIASLLLLIAPGIGAPLLKLTAWALDGIWYLLERMAQLPYAQWISASPPFLYTLLASIGALWWLLPRGLPGHRHALLLLLPAVCWCPPRPSAGTYWLTLLDVGQGLAIVVETRAHTLVYDTGPKLSTATDSGLNIVLPYLQQQGYSTLNMLIVSHGDNDHAGGAASLLAHLDVERTLSSVPEKISAQAAYCKAGQSWRWDNVQFEILGPDGSVTSGKKGNNQSCVLKITATQGRTLLTGDIEKPAEAALLQKQGARLRSEVLVAPHHGSKTSSSQDFLETVKPIGVLIGSGYHNHFHHPHPDVLRRYQALNLAVFNSAEEGAVLLRPATSTGDHGMQVDGYRRLHPHYWRKRPGD